ncbi:uncharacterized protein [Heterodontus francisci]|uniref:uncharacterized protein isoform X2 n=1 Tax=Heterodontus francisci TaxID=7792 RepID=UPI00355C0FDB
MSPSKQQDTNNSERKDLLLRVTDKQLMKLAGKLGNSWKSLAIEHLGFKGYDVERFHADGNDNKNKAFLMLQDWKCKTKCPTVRSLIVILDEANVNPEAWAFLDNKDNDFNDLRCKCCHLVDCQCKCKLAQDCQIKMAVLEAVDVQTEARHELDKLFEELFKTDGNLRFKFVTIIHSMEAKLLKIAKGCIKFQLQILSYAALLNLSLLFEKGASEGIKQLPPLHQELQNALSEEFSHANITTAKFSFTNYFEGGSYRSALEFFCGGFAIDDMLPIIKKQIEFRNIDYLCIDMKTAPQTTLSDLKREFVKQHRRKLRKLKRKVLKRKTLSQSDSELMNKLIDDILNESDKEQRLDFQKDKTRELSEKKVKKTNRKAVSGEETREKSELRDSREKKIYKAFEASGNKEKVLEGLETPDIKMKGIQDFVTPGKKRKRIQDVKITTMEMKDVQELKMPRRKTHKFEPSVEKLHTSDPHAETLGTSLTYVPPLKQMKITSYSKHLREDKVSQEIHSPMMKEKEVTQLKFKEESTQSKRRNQKGQIDFGQEASTSKMMEHTHIQEKTVRKRPTDMDSNVTTQQLKSLAKNLGHWWKNLATEGLGMSKNVIRQMELDKTGPKDRALEILMGWKKQEKHNPTIRNLIDVLNKAKISSDLWEFLNPETDAFKDIPVTNKSSKRKHEAKRKLIVPKTERPEKQGKTFEVVLLSMLNNKPKKCYGCSKKLLDATNPDLILRTQDVREYYGPCRQRHRASQPSNVYFHLLKKCVEKKYGLLNQHNVIVPNEVLILLTSIQLTTLKNMNIIHDAGDKKSKHEIEKLEHATSAQYKKEEVKTFV